MFRDVSLYFFHFEYKIPDFISTYLIFYNPYSGQLKQTDYFSHVILVYLLLLSDAMSKLLD